MAFERLGHLARCHIENVDNAIDSTARNVLAIGALKWVLHETLLLSSLSSNTYICNAERKFAVLWIQHLFRLARLYTVQRNLSLVRTGNDVLIAW